MKSYLKKLPTAGQDAFDYLAMAVMITGMTIFAFAEWVLKIFPLFVMVQFALLLLQRAYLVAKTWGSEESVASKAFVSASAVIVLALMGAIAVSFAIVGGFAASPFVFTAMVAYEFVETLVPLFKSVKEVLFNPTQENKTKIAANTFNMATSAIMLIGVALFFFVPGAQIAGAAIVIAMITAKAIFKGVQMAREKMAARQQDIIKYTVLPKEEKDDSRQKQDTLNTIKISHSQPLKQEIKKGRLKNKNRNSRSTAIRIKLN